MHLGFAIMTLSKSRMHNELFIGLHFNCITEIIGRRYLQQSVKTYDDRQTAR